MMDHVSKDELNAAAMQIILHAGDCRNLMNEAIIMTENDGNIEEIDAKLKEAKAEITEAHRIQTEMIQGTIEDDELETTLLFSHAQDTLMTIYSELNMTNSILRLYRKLTKGGN